MSLFTYFLYALYYALFYVSSAQAYGLDKKFDSSNFLDSFDFIERHDNYIGGCANYVSKQDATSMGLARTTGDQVYLRVDNSSIYDVTQPDAGRKSVRLEGHDTIDSGIIITDFEHLPANACGMWPSFWLLHDSDGPGDDWYSEIDIIESVSERSQNEVTLYTDPAECIMTPQAGTGDVFRTNCELYSGGCGVLAPEGTFGDSFNQKGGGVWATQIEADGIKIWYFARSDIPADIESDKPDPKKWGQPVMNFEPGGNCDVSRSWRKMKMIINITFCGDYAGGPSWGGHYTECSSKTGFASCNEYVARNPAAFDDVYFLVNSIKTYH